MTLPRTLPLALLALVAALALAPASASAKRVPIRVGIGDQQTAMFDQAPFQALKIKRVRYFIAWNAIDDPARLAAADAYVQRAKLADIQVLLHLSSDDLRIKKAKLPSVSQYKSKVGKLVKRYRAMGVKEFGAFNEANHASQPTYRSPTRAASFFKVLYQLVKPKCRSCAVVALDVLDQGGVERYMRSFYRALGPTYRKRATVVGIHNYGDVNRQRTTYTRSMIRQARVYNAKTKFWFTETGGIVKFNPSFPCSTTRAKHRLSFMFKLARLYRTSGVQRVYIYNYTGAGCTARFDSGLTDPDGSPRAGYAYVKAALVNYLR